MIASPSRIALAVPLLVACAAAAQDADVYTRTLRSTALIMTPTGGGTGWVVDLDRGLLVTNEHVVRQHAEVELVFPEYRDGRPLAEPGDYQRVRRLRAEVIDADGPRDLALVRLRARPPAGVVALKVAPLEPRPADRVHSIGNPDASGALWVYSTGTVRQVYRKDWRFADGLARSARIVEMQSPINPGDSGGPVVNDAGELVGVVSGKKADAALMSWCIAAAEVRAYLTEALPLVDPKTAAAFRRRGVRTLDRGQAARAVEDLSAAHRLDPKSADVLADRAMAYRVRKDFDLARDDLAEALRLDPRHAGAVNVRGCVHTDFGRNDEALVDFRRAIQLDPRVAVFHANRAQAHANKGEFEPAARSLDEALRLAPGVADWYYRRATAHEQLGVADKAEEDYVRAVQLDPTYRERLTLHRGKAVKVVNRTGQPIRVYLRYEGPAAGRLAWLPGEGVLMWDFAPGEEAILTHDGQPVVARRMRIWADNAATKTAWYAVKDQDTWTTTAVGYRGGPRPEVFTYTFNP
ncbi:MAG TPA: tetratricopeptide repeat-containing serine protease family protein [Gemmataceae bacterium]|nr:tetratricopeptide repeat-containing serine protease family protein [Gemmataceae bacterium]